MATAVSVRDNILLAQYAAGVQQNPAKADALLAQLGLSAHADKKPHTLSHGQQQRVAIARAAINGPQLILGDEPTSALDDVSCGAVMELLLSTAQAAGSSLVIATHDARIRKYFTQTITLGSAA